MSGRYTLHALDRARERYHENFGHADMLAIFRECESGLAVIQRSDTGNKGNCVIYIVQHRGFRTMPVVVMREDGRPSHIITFNPSDSCVAGQARRHRVETGRLKSHRPRNGHGCGLDSSYRRDRQDWRKELDEVDG